MAAGDSNSRLFILTYLLTYLLYATFASEMNV